MQYAPPLPASLVAKWFVARAQLSRPHDLDNLKLQKLLYFAQSRYLHAKGAPLIKEPIEAWEHGPVVNVVYHEYSSHGRKPIELDLTEDGPWTHLDVDAEMVLDEVWSAFGVYSGWKLRDITHELGPWPKYWVKGPKHISMPQDEIGAAWADFARLEADGDSELRTLGDPLARFKVALSENPLGERSGDPSQLLEDLDATAPLRREATTLHS